MLIGKRYIVKKEHPFHGGKAGVFEFMGGPNADVVVLCHEQHPGGCKSYICVSEDSIDYQED